MTLPPATVRALLTDTVVTTRDDRARAVVLRFPTGTNLSTQEGEDDVVLRFDRAPAETEWSRLGEAAGSALAARWNDATLLLQPAPGWHVRVVVDGAAARILLWPDPAAAVIETAGEDPVDFALVKVAADTAAGYPGRAQKRLAALERAHPADPRVARAVADAAFARGARGIAARRLRALGATDSDARAALRRAGGELGVASGVRSGDGFTQVDTAVRLAGPVSDAANASLAVRHVHTHADTVATPSGAAGAISPERVVAEAGVGVFAAPYLRLELLTAAELRDTRVGVSGRLVAGPPEAEARAFAAWHVPDLLTAEQAQFGGHSDRIGAGGTLRLSPATTAQLDLTLTRYQLAGRGRVADSVTVSAALDQVLRRQHPSLSIGYRLEAEYLETLDRVAGGVPALPLATRENHTVSLAVGDSLGPVYLGGSAGWTLDRFGSSGPTATLTATADLAGGWRAELGGGVSSVSRPGLPGTTVQARGAVTRALGRP